MSEYLTIEQIRERLPEGARPSYRLLRETAQRLDLGRRWGRHLVLTESEARCLLAYGSEASIGTRAGKSRCAKRTAKSRGSELKNQLERQRDLERFGLLKTSKTTTGSKPTGHKPRPSPSQTQH